MDIGYQILTLFVLAIPAACISWTVTHEEIFRELREYFKLLSETKSNILVRKFFFIFTCEYCFSHYVVIFLLIITGFRMIYDDWRGILIAGFSLVWIANLYMSIFGRIRLEIKKERVEIENKPGDEEKSNNSIS